MLLIILRLRSELCSVAGVYPFGNAEGPERSRGAQDNACAVVISTSAEPATAC